MNIIVTAAGAGQRFVDAGYRDVIKPFIPINDEHTILTKTLSSLPFFSETPGVSENNVTFAFPELHTGGEELDDLFSRYRDNFSFSLFPQLTRGNLETAYITCLQTRPDPDEPLLILDSDNYFDGSGFLSAIEVMDLFSKMGDNPNAGYSATCCFEPLDQSTKWGFVIPNVNDRCTNLGKINIVFHSVANILEKDPNALKLGGKPMMGVFYFSKASIFLKVAHDILYNPSPRDIKEFYMTESLTACLHKEIPVFALTVGGVIPLGTPEDLVAYQNTLKDKT